MKKVFLLGLLLVLFSTLVFSYCSTYWDGGQYEGKWWNYYVDFNLFSVDNCDSNIYYRWDYDASSDYAWRGETRPPYSDASLKGYWTFDDYFLSGGLQPLIKNLADKSILPDNNYGMITANYFGDVNVFGMFDTNCLDNNPLNHTASILVANQNGDLNTSRFTKQFTFSWWDYVDKEATTALEGQCIMDWGWVIACFVDNTVDGDLLNNLYLGFSPDSNVGTSINDWTITGFPVHEFSHFVISFDNNAFKVYFNGDLNYVTTDYAGVGVGSPSLGIYRNYVFTKNRLDGQPLNGKIDDFKYYDRAISAEEVKMDYNSFVLYDSNNIYPFYKKDWNVNSLSSDGNWSVQWGAINSDKNEIDLNMSNFWFGIDITNPIIIDDHNILGTNYSTDVNIQVKCSDATSGISSVNYHLSTGVDVNYFVLPELTMDYNIGIYFSGDQNTRVDVYCDDNASNSGKKTFWVSLDDLIDEEPPVLTHDLNSYWVNGDVNVQFRCVDANGVDSFWYDLDNNGWLGRLTGSTDANFGITITTDLNHSISYYCSDAIDNNSTTLTSYILIDKSFPLLSDDHNSGWQRGDADVNLTCSDVTSGIRNISYQIDSGSVVSTNFDPSVRDKNVLINITGDLNHHVWYYCDDNANNYSTKEFWVGITKNPPKIYHDANFGWQNTDANVQLTCADGTDIDSIWYSVDNNSWVYRSINLLPEVTIGVVINTDLNHKVMAYCSSVGNGYSDTNIFYVSIDKGKPVTTDGNFDIWQQYDFNAHLYCSDVLSGCYKTYFRKDINPFSSIDANTNGELSLTKWDDDSLLIYYQANDNNSGYVWNKSPIGGSKYNLKMNGFATTNGIGVWDTNAGRSHIESTSFFGYNYNLDLNSGSWTWSAWLRIHNAQLNTYKSAFTLCENTTIAGKCVRCGEIGSPDGLITNWVCGVSDAINARTTEANIDSNRAYHLALSYNHNKQDLKLYVDGVLVATTHSPSPISISGATKLYVGGHGAGTGGFDWDEWKFFTRELSSGEIYAQAKEYIPYDSNILFNGLDGNYQIKFFSLDNATNMSDIETHYFLKDTNSPQLFSEHNSGWQSVDQNVMISCTKLISYLSTINWFGYTVTKLGEYSTPFMVRDLNSWDYNKWVYFTDDGNYQVDWNCTNEAGVVSTKSLWVGITTNPPIVYSNAPNNWLNSDFNLQISCGTVGDEIVDINYNLDGSGWVSKAIGLGLVDATIGLEITTDGNHEVQMVCGSSVNGASAVVINYVALDKIKPATIHSQLAGEITLNCTDATSGCALTYYNLNNSAWLTGNSITLPLGDSNIQYYSVDNAGNIEDNKSYLVSNAVEPPTDTGGTGGGAVTTTITGITGEDVNILITIKKISGNIWIFADTNKFGMPYDVNYILAKLYDSTTPDSNQRLFYEYDFDKWEKISTGKYKLNMLKYFEHSTLLISFTIDSKIYEKAIGFEVSQLKETIEPISNQFSIENIGKILTEFWWLILMLIAFFLLLLFMSRKKKEESGSIYA